MAEDHSSRELIEQLVARLERLEHATRANAERLAAVERYLRGEPPTPERPRPTPPPPPAAPP
ncbi:MAG TPA: hypothetical protein VN228_04660, partial [Pyrinomonadaceae bacterium]|nr:hypothetical protein [Pyrinomonadaceae bacterium]